MVSREEDGLLVFGVNQTLSSLVTTRSRSGRRCCSGPQLTWSLVALCVVLVFALSDVPNNKNNIMIGGANAEPSGLFHRVPFIFSLGSLSSLLS